MDYTHVDLFIKTYQYNFPHEHIPLNKTNPFTKESVILTKDSVNSINMHSNWKHIYQNIHLQTLNEVYSYSNLTQLNLWKGK